MPAVVTQYPRILLQQHQRASAWATGGVRGKYTWPLPVMSPVVM